MKYIFLFIASFLLTASQKSEAQPAFEKLKKTNAFYHLQDSLKSLFHTGPFKQKNISTRNNAKENFSSFTASTCNTYFCSFAVLPVTGMELTGTRLNNERVLLNWKTFSEYNDIGFDVERSFTGANGSFEYIGLVNGAGNSNTELHYSLTDNNNFKGVSYYRLKQKDIDGHFVYSNIAAVKGYSEKATLQIYPNPGSNADIVFLITGLDQNQQLGVCITDVVGRIILQKNNCPLSSGEVHLSSLINLRPGFYTVSFLSQTVKLRASFVVLK